MTTMLTVPIRVTINDVERAVPVFQLIQWKHAIKLEMEGLRYSRGNVCAHVKKLFNIHPQEKRQVVLNAIVDVLEQVESHIKEKDNADANS